MSSADPRQLKAVLLRMMVLAGIWAGLVGLLIAAGEVVTRSAALSGFDHHATSVVVSWRTPALNAAMEAVTWLGSWVALLVAAAIIAVLVITRRLPVLAAVVAVFAWAGGAGGVRIGKAVVRRDRPPQAIWLVHAHGSSFPSGHAAAACLVFTVLAMCIATLGGRVVRIAGWLAAGLAIAATAFSRVELGVHWTIDVLASIAFMASWLTAIVVSLGGCLRPPEPIADHADGPQPVAAPELDPAGLRYGRRMRGGCQLTMHHHPARLRYSAVPRKDSVMAGQVSRQYVIDWLRRLGFPQLVDEASRDLPDPVDLEQVYEFGHRHHISLDEVISRMGGSP